jgi:hypothetical protein
MLKTQKKTNPIPPFAQASFLKFATLPRDRKWNISKLATLPRAPYQPHANNNDGELVSKSVLGLVISLVRTHQRQGFHRILPFRIGSLHHNS